MDKYSSFSWDQVWVGVCVCVWVCVCVGVILGKL